MSADFASIAHLINEHADGTTLDRSQLVTMLEEAAHRDPEVTASAARAVNYHQADRDTFLHAAAQRATSRIVEQLQYRGTAERYNAHQVAVALRSAAGSEVDAIASRTTR